MKTPLKIILVGTTGRMGQAISALAKSSSQFEIIDKDPESFRSNDVVVDFSSHAAIGSILKGCVRNRTPLIIGTTDHSEREMASIRDAASNIPLIHSPNFSIGATLQAWLCEKIGWLSLEGFGARIIETHHDQKKDVTSGTAKQLGHLLGSKGAFPTGITIHSIRVGTVVGEHEVRLIGTGEQLKLEHVAVSRECFAAGALRAVKWIKGKPPGYYTMFDVLGLK